MCHYLQRLKLFIYGRKLYLSDRNRHNQLALPNKRFITTNFQVITSIEASHRPASLDNCYIPYSPSLTHRIRDSRRSNGPSTQQLVDPNIKAKPDASYRQTRPLQTADGSRSLSSSF